MDDVEEWSPNPWSENSAQLSVCMRIQYISNPLTDQNRQGIAQVEVSPAEAKTLSKQPLIEVTAADDGNRSQPTPQHKRRYQEVDASFKLRRALYSEKSRLEYNKVGDTSANTTLLTVICRT